MGQSTSDAMFRFIDCIQHLEDQQAIATELLRTAGAFGFTGFGVCGIPKPGESIEPYLILPGCDPEWLARYLEKGYIHWDPVIGNVRRTDTPFTWDEACRGKLDPNAQRVMDEASEFGMRDGLMVPIHTLEGLSAFVTFTGERIELSERDRGALHMIAIYAHSRIKQLLVNHAEDLEASVPFSLRERECVLWCAAGKTNWEIGRITGLAEKTVEAYLRNASSKVGAINRAQLVAESLRQKRIH
ncbi:helix-turn-helix transcriptional regulator [Jiella mangrovi]|uniref:LuxR family transcriptional regulator n=1 Tax=Jiella mangrovi TaxID=2821407 RepID=A0ABS4BEQ3_9HYPH|nr:LuxR family transcriptional regulator [Jiella mangrovi]MBP0615242.1 LuxR family transcriptional regulator [Jiella mangrovi]